MENKQISKKVAYMGAMFSLTLVLSYLEYNLLPPLPINGVKLGLSNIVVMYCVFFKGGTCAFSLGFLKSVFVLMTRGAISGVISLFGGLTSILVMSFAYKYEKDKKGYVFVSLLGGVFHNIGQLICASFILKSTVIYYYLPILIISGIIVGFITATIFKILTPYLKNTSNE